MIGTACDTFRGFSGSEKESANDQDKYNCRRSSHLTPRTTRIVSNRDENHNFNPSFRLIEKTFDRGGDLLACQGLANLAAFFVQRRH